MSHINITTVRVAGPCAILFALLVGVSDMGLMGFPVSGAELDERNLEPLLHRSPTMLYLSTFGGLAILGLTCGSWVLWEGVKPLGAKRALPPIVLITLFWWIGCTVHFSYGYIGDALQVQARVGPEGAAALQTHSPTESFHPAMADRDYRPAGGISVVRTPCSNRSHLFPPLVCSTCSVFSNRRRSLSDTVASRPHRGIFVCRVYSLRHALYFRCCFMAIVGRCKG